VFGLDDYQDPESIAPAVLEIEPGIIDRDAPLDSVIVTVELPGYRLDAILLDTLLVNGIPPVSVETGDADRDLNPDLIARFDTAVLLQTLPLSGEGKISASAQLMTSGIQLEGHARVVVLASDTDLDRDGVDDLSDLCPDTVAGELPDLDGCSVTQLCPCEGSAEKSWRNHGQYLVCVIRAAKRVSKQHHLPNRQLKNLVPASARLVCGQREHQVKVHGQHNQVKRGGWRQ